MSSRCPWVTDRYGVRHRSGSVFYRITNEDGSEVVYAVRTDIPRGAVRESGVEGVAGEVPPELLHTLGDGEVFGIIGGVEVPTELDPAACRGGSGRRNISEGVFERYRETHGEDAMLAMIEVAMKNLPARGEGETIGESKGWARQVVMEASRAHPDGAYGVLSRHPHGFKVFRESRRAENPRDLELDLAYRWNENPVVLRVMETPRQSSGVRATLLAAESLNQDEWVDLLGHSDPTVARAAMAAAGYKLPGEILESYVKNAPDVVLAAAAMRALGKADPERAETVAYDAVRRSRDSSDEFSHRLAEAGIAHLDARIRNRIAETESTPWQWKTAAIAEMDPVVDAATIARVVQNKSEHPLVRIAAVAKCEDRVVLAGLGGDKDERVRDIAVRNLIGEEHVARRVERTPRIRGVLENDGKNVRMCGIDMDGTLLDERGRVVEANARGVRTFADNGGAVCFVTTRSMETALERARTALDGRNGVLVCDDGLTICDVQTGAVLRTSAPDVLPRGVKDGHEWILEGSPREVAEEIKTWGFEAGTLKVQKNDGGGTRVTYSREKDAAIEDVARMFGVGLHECAVFGDGRVDVPMFERVTNAGGISVAVANAQPGVIDHRSVGIVCESNEDGGVGKVLESLSNGALPEYDPEGAVFLQAFSDGLSIPRNEPKREVYSYLHVEDGGAMREALRSSGLSHLVDTERGMTQHGGTPAVPGHVTYAHPNDWRGREMPEAPEGAVSIVGYVDRPEVKAVVCALDTGDGPSEVRPDGKVFHVTLKTATGVPPVVSNEAIQEGWTRLDTPIPVATKAVRSRTGR